MGIWSRRHEGKGRRRAYVERYSGSKRIILECECGERFILSGFEEDWRSRRAVFKCECGQKLTLDDRIDKETLAAS